LESPSPLFDVALEVVQDRLPTFALNVRRILGLGVECFLHENPVGALDELHAHLAMLISNGPPKAR
jgi:hypothetical protein